MVYGLSLENFHGSQVSVLIVWSGIGIKIYIFSLYINISRLGLAYFPWV